MLYVKTHIANSSIHGIGLFASEKIEAGTIVCQWYPPLDINISYSISLDFPASIIKYLNHFCFEIDKVVGFLLFGDDFRFVNHSVSANLFTYIGSKGKTDLAFVALKDIKEQTELTIDYSTLSMPHYLTLKKDFTEMRDNKPWPPRMGIDRLKKEE